MSMTRRNFIQGLLAAPLLALLPRRAPAALLEQPTPALRPVEQRLQDWGNPGVAALLEDPAFQRFMRAEKKLWELLDQMPPAPWNDPEILRLLELR